MYIPVSVKFGISMAAAAAWAAFAFAVAMPWIASLSTVVPEFLAYLIIFGIAIIPGFMNMFLVASLLMDRRPKKKELDHYPSVTVLIAAYNEEANISATIESIARQVYPGELTTIVVDDGSKDLTTDMVRPLLSKYPWLRLVEMVKNGGKAAALNRAFQEVTSEITITIDADCYLFRDAIRRLIERMVNNGPNCGAVAGAVLVRNSRENLVTKIQEWDYFHGIAAVKRLQSLYQGTLVAQGAFSAYRTHVLKEVGGWPHSVGEDIVLTWGILKKDYRICFAEDAVAFTNVPDTWRQFIRQRQRWSRGMIEAFKDHSSLLLKPKMHSVFIWWNLMFPYLDLTYTFAFLPGLVLALFGIFWIAGPMTLLVLPLALLVNYLMFTIQSRMFIEQGLKVRRNPIGFIFYALLYSAILQPACVFGYIKEVFDGATKNWGTK